MFINGFFNIIGMEKNTLPDVLFGVEGYRETDLAKKALDDAGIEYRFYSVNVSGDPQYFPVVLSTSSSTDAKKADN